MSQTPSDGDGDRSDAGLASRRAFLAMAGGLAAVGAPTPTAGASTADGRGGALAVDGTSIHSAFARQVAERVRRDHGVAVSLDASGTTPALERLADGDVDVTVAGRPMSPSEAARARANDVAHVGREIVADAATLRVPKSEWFDCVTPAALAARWTAPGEVETWAEIPAADRAEAVSVDRPAADDGAGRTAGSAGADLPPPGETGVPLVRGVREFQYDSGFGGVGYYEPGGERLASPAEDGGDGDGSDATLVRLLYLYVDRASLRRPAVAAFVRRGVAATADGVGYYPDPYRAVPRADEALDAGPS